MNLIYEANDNFPFDKLKLTTPTLILGGNHFMKYLIAENPLYIQTPKCSLKTTFIKAQKKMFCDILISRDSESFIRWMETLENFSQQFIFNKRNDWFESDLELHDIENSMTSPLKPYKSGKYYILRITIPSVLGKSNLKIFNEDEEEIDSEELKEDMEFYGILEFKGIKCSSKSFHIEIEMKQMQVLKPLVLFDKCIFPNAKKDLGKPAAIEAPISVSAPITTAATTIENDASELTPSTENIVMSVNDAAPMTEPQYDSSVANETTHMEEPTIKTEPLIDADTDADTDKEMDEIQELDIQFDNLEESGDDVQLKKRNDVHYLMYKEAIEKAKMAKNLSISSYLEAKRIKNLYMLDEFLEMENDDDSDLEEFVKNH